MDSLQTKLVVGSSIAVLIALCVVLALYFTGYWSTPNVDCKQSTWSACDATGKRTRITNVPASGNGTACGPLIEMCTVTPVAGTTTPVLDPAPFKNICNKHNKCIAAPKNNNTPGVQMIQFSKTTEEGQLFSHDLTTGHICNKHGLCLEVANNNNGDVLYHNTKQDIDNQKWKFTESGNLCNKISDYTKCIASPGNNAGDNTILIQWDKNTEEKGQQWSFI